ncbi:MAG: hypothetical protein ABI242_08140, partial [Caulobacteraceae bacterium]
MEPKVNDFLALSGSAANDEAAADPFEALLAKLRRTRRRRIAEPPDVHPSASFALRPIKAPDPPERALLFDDPSATAIPSRAAADRLGDPSWPSFSEGLNDAAAPPKPPRRAVRAGPGDLVRPLGLVLALTGGTLLTAALLWFPVARHRAVPAASS